jgi:osmoprotectant transport system permease protein
VRDALVTCAAVVAMAAAVGCGGDDKRAPAEPIVVGSKTFTESVVLGEVLVQLAASTGREASHTSGLGGSAACFKALLRGDLDAYPEYTGTLRLELLKEMELETDAQLRDALSDMGVRMTETLGFNNTYAIGVTRDTAAAYGLDTVSDLTEHPELRLGFSNEFMNRGDGWPGLREVYGLENRARGMDHDLAYRGLVSGGIDATDLYTTDAEIEYYDLVALEDDRGYFTEYNAVVLYRAELERTAPSVVEAWERLEGALDAERMSALNRLAKIGVGPEGEEERVPSPIVASRFLDEALGVGTDPEVETSVDVVRRTTVEHLQLVAMSMTIAIVLALPLGVLAARVPSTTQAVLWVVGTLQTMPSLALLVLLIPLLGLGTLPAVVALFLYSLLPIVRNTYAGLVNISGDIIESADAIGLTPRERLFDVELPIALPTILAGIKTSVVINVGTATLAAFIGAGGYGQPILTGIRQNDFSVVLLGAAPAAVMAIAAQLIFDGAERTLVSRGLRGG